MGFTEVPVRISNLADPSRFVDLTMVADSGAFHSIVPGKTLRQLGIRPRRTETFAVADGRTIRRQVGYALFSTAGKTGPAPVVFGRRGDETLLGVLSLEAMALMVDPVRQRLRQFRPMRL